MKYISILCLVLISCESKYDQVAVRDWSQPPPGCPVTFASGDTIRWEKRHHDAYNCDLLFVGRDSLDGCTFVAIGIPPAR
jgi:hypothetical protein